MRALGEAEFFLGVDALRIIFLGVLTQDCFPLLEQDFTGEEETEQQRFTGVLLFEGVLVHSSSELSSSPEYSLRISKNISRAVILVVK